MRRSGIGSAIVVVGLLGSLIGAAPAAAKDRSTSVGSESLVARPHRVDVQAAAAHPRAGTGEIHGLRKLASPPRELTQAPYRGPAPKLVGGGTKALGPKVVEPPSDLLTATSFDGLAYDCSGSTCGEPPDPTVAASSNYLVQAINTAVQIYDRSGTPLLDAPVSFADFFGEPAGETGDTDPHVMWDAAHGRWLASEASWSCGTDTGSAYIAFSDGADPTAGWISYQLSFAGELPDFPALGSSSDKVALSVNRFALSGGGSDCVGEGDFAGGFFGAFDWADVGDMVTVQGTHLYDSGFAWRPASNPTTLTIHGIGEDADTGHVLYAAISGTQGAGNLTFSAPYDLTAAGKAGAFATPPAPEQQGTPATIADAVDSRPTDAVWAAGHLWFVATAPCTPDGDTQERACVRLVELSTATTTPTVLQDFEISDNGFDNFMGGIGLSGVGSLVVVYSQSSPTTFVSTYARVQEPGATAGTMGSPRLVEEGQGTYSGDRWGDYVIVSPAPPEPTAVWQADEYPTADGHWATTISQLLVQATYVPLAAPVRLLDSRTGTGLSGAFVRGKPRTFQVTGRGGVPADAVAVTGNLTVTNQAAAGYVALTTTPQPAPSTSTINFPLGDVRANGVTAPLGSDGTLSATYVGGTSTSSTHLVFDVTGYFVPGTASDTYTQVTPARLLDTRSGVGFNGPLVRAVPQAFRVTGHGGVPDGAVAVTGNLTAVGMTAAGYISLTTASTPAPTTSTLNFPLKDVRANGVTVPLGTGADAGRIWATYIGGAGSASTQLIFDVTGYYAADAGGAVYVPLSPVRTLDTRAGDGLSSKFVRATPRTLQVTGRTNVPAAAIAISGNLTVVNQAAAGYVSVTLDPVANPTTSTINFPLGDIRANNLTTPLNAGKLSATYVGGGSTSTTDVILDVTGFFEPPPH